MSATKPTKAELEEAILMLQRENDELRARLAEQNTVIVESAEEGFIVEAPNKHYNGVTAGLKFRNGFGFIPTKNKDARRLAAILSKEYGYMVTKASYEEYDKLVEEHKPVEPQGLSPEQILEM